MQCDAGRNLMDRRTEMNSTGSQGDRQTRIAGGPLQIAVLDDYQRVALSLADWSTLASRASITLFHDHLPNADDVVQRLMPFHVVCVMRERTPLTGEILRRLPNLKLIASTAFRNASIDIGAAESLGIAVVHTGYTSAPTIELTWGLILASARYIVTENASLRGGGWQRSLGDDLSGKPLGLLGLGNIGHRVAETGRAFPMAVYTL